MAKMESAGLYNLGSAIGGALGGSTGALIGGGLGTIGDVGMAVMGAGGRYGGGTMRGAAQFGAAAQYPLSSVQTGRRNRNY